jgi:hypothetical protein
MAGMTPGFFCLNFSASRVKGSDDVSMGVEGLLAFTGGLPVGV